MPIYSGVGDHAPAHQPPSCHSLSTPGRPRPVLSLILRRSNASYLPPSGQTGREFEPSSFSRQDSFSQSAHLTWSIPSHSARKALKIRPGFTPAEDVQKYRSTGAKDAARLKGYVPGASTSSSSTYQAPPELSSDSAFPALGGGMTKAQKKNLARRNKKKEEKEEDARNWDSEEDDMVEVEEGKLEVNPKVEPKPPKSALSGIQSTLQSLRIDEPTSSSSLNSPTIKSTTETTTTSSPRLSTKPTVRPGGGLFRDLPIKSKDQPASSSSVLPSQPPETQSVPASNPKSQPSKTTSTLTGQPRTRPEVRVRPGGGLQGLHGLVRQMAAEGEGQRGTKR